MPHPPLVSIIMPAYNAQSTIGAAISGALTQTHPAVELVVADDGSTDRTPQLCAAYGEEIRYLRLPNGGSASARNAALRAARGDFLVLCDSDDVLLPPFIETALQTWTAAGGGRRLVTGEATLLTPAGIAHGRKVLLGPVPPPEQQRLRILQGNFVSIFALFPRAMLDDVNGFDETLRFREDWDFWLRAVFAGWQVVEQPVPHALYRWSATAKTTKVEGYAAEDEILRRARQREGERLSAEELAYLTRRLDAGSPRLLIIRAEAALRSGDHGQARRLLWQASQLQPADRKLKLKAGSLRYLPPAAPFWQRRLGRIDHALGRESGQVR